RREESAKGLSWGRRHHHRRGEPQAARPVPSGRGGRGQSWERKRPDTCLKRRGQSEEQTTAIGIISSLIVRRPQLLGTDSGKKGTDPVQTKKACGESHWAVRRGLFRLDKLPVSCDDSQSLEERRGRTMLRTAVLIDPIQSLLWSSRRNINRS